jgi:hypothetical protein
MAAVMFGLAGSAIADGEGRASNEGWLITVRAGLVDSQVRAHPTIAVRDDVGDEGRNALP